MVLHLFEVIKGIVCRYIAMFFNILTYLIKIEQIDM